MTWFLFRRWSLALAASHTLSCPAFGIPQLWAQLLSASRHSSGFVHFVGPGQHSLASLTCYNQTGMSGMWVYILSRTHQQPKRHLLSTFWVSFKHSLPPHPHPLLTHSNSHITSPLHISSHTHGSPRHQMQTSHILFPGYHRAFWNSPETWYQSQGDNIPILPMIYWTFIIGSKHIYFGYLSHLDPGEKVVFLLV